MAACALAGDATAAADDAAWMFEPDHVTEIDLDLPAASREALAADPDEYVEAAFSLTREDGTTYGPLTVGVKLKGNASFRPLSKKAAFKVKFDDVVDDQTFLGLEKLTLNNMVQDPTMVHELLAYEAFRAAGVPGWRTGYSFVRVDGDDFGVYLNIETPDEISLRRWHATTQHLYEGAKFVDVVPGDAPAFEVDEGDEDDRADLEALIAAVADWSGVERVADLDEMTRYWAVERYIGHRDGYTQPNPNNFYLHSDDEGRFTMLPWGTDQTWERPRGYADPGGALFDGCLADGACLALYRAAVEDVRATLGALDLESLASETAAMLEPWQQMDVRRESTSDQTRAALADLYGFLATRPFATWPDAASDDPAGGPQPTDDTGPQQPIVPPPLGPGPATTPLVRERLTVTVSPRRVRRGVRRRFTIRVTTGGRPVRAAQVVFAGRERLTNARGRAHVRMRPRRRGLLRARATAEGFSRGRARVRVLRAEAPLRRRRA